MRNEGVPLEVIELSRGTLHGAVDGVRMTFLEYPYEHVAPPISWSASDCRLASLDDLATMKLSAVAGRGSRKEFVDTYALGQVFQPLAETIRAYQRR